MLAKPLRLLVLSVAATVVWGQSLADFEKRVTEFTLSNGLRFIVLERHDAPVVSMNMFVNAGAVDDPGGQSSMAHMFEHMIGKGTTAIGTKNWAAESKALAKVEQVYDQVENERRLGARANKEKLQQLEANLKDAIESANGFVEQNKYVQVIEENGGTGFNAGTAQDFTMYHYSLPSNRLELWFLLQSEWVKRPVFREFYKERDVVREERRMRVESSTQGKLQELLMATAFMAHPYRNTIGWASEIENLRAKEAEAFWKKYYTPGNMVITIVGDVSPAEARKLAEKYYGNMPAGPAAPPVLVQEPPQSGEKRASLESDSQPIVFIGYKRPAQDHKDDVVFDVISDILSSGRTGLLYRDLVRDKKISLGSGSIATVPSGKYPNMMMLYSFPAVGHNNEENEKAIYAILDGLKNTKVDDATLKRVKTKLRAGLIRQLDSNPGLALQLAFYEVPRGWSPSGNAAG